MANGLSDSDGGCVFFFQAEDGIRDDLVTGVQTCALPICNGRRAGFTTREAVVPRGNRNRLHYHRIGVGWSWHLPRKLVRRRRGQAERLSVHLDAVKKDINLDRKSVV